MFAPGYLRSAIIMKSCRSSISVAVSNTCFIFIRDNILKMLENFTLMSVSMTSVNRILKKKVFD